MTGTPQALSPTEDADFRQWLGKSGAHIMRRVIDGKLHLAQLEHLKDAMDSAQFPLKAEASTAALLKAQRYQTFLQIWQELIDQTPDVPFETVTLS